MLYNPHLILHRHFYFLSIEYTYHITVNFYSGYISTSKQFPSAASYHECFWVMYFLNNQRRDNEVLMLIGKRRQSLRQVNFRVWTNSTFCDNQHKARHCQNRQCIIILFHLAYGGSNLQKCFTWGMCSRRAWHILCCQHLSYCADWLQTFHFSWMSRNVTSDICTKKAISTNQSVQVEEINGILLERKCNLISTASVSCTALIALHVALLPLPLWESRPFFFLATE